MPAILLDFLNRMPLWPLGFALLVLMTLSFFIGRRLNIRAARRGSARATSTFDGFIVSAMLGLLALLMGFTFSLAIQRFEERRQLVVQEANGIGTAYLRAQLLDAPDRQRLSGLLLDYTKAQIALADVGYPQAGPLRRHNEDLLTRIWAATVAALDSPRNASFSLALTGAVNNVIDLDATRKTARAVRVPVIVFDALVVYLVSVAGMLGYVIGKGRETTVACLTMALMSTALLLVIDIDRPGSGSIRESQQPMLDVRQSLLEQPPAVFDRWRDLQAREQAQRNGRQSVATPD